MPAQDYVTSWQRHRTAVSGLCSALLGAGLTEHMGPGVTLPAFAFVKAPQRSVLPALGVAPRDLVVRLGGEPVSVKVYRTNGEQHSSLFRAVSYAVIATSGPYLQVVTDAPALPIPWLASLQPPLDTTTPTGIHGEAAFIVAVEAAVAARSPQQLPLIP